MNSNKKITNNKNFQLVPVKVNYFLKDKIISIKQFLLTSTFGSILEYFQKNIKPKTNTKLKEKYICNNSNIDLNTPLINLIEFKKNSSSSTIESVEIFIELDEIKSKNNDYPIFNKLIQPKENPFGIYVFQAKEGIITLEKYSEEIIKKYELYKYNSNYSSYCNSPKYLYISGGKLDDNILLDDFWIISNNKYSIIKKKMPYKKCNHSMIYIFLENKEYIFIAGGDNNLITFYYDLNMDSFVIWSNMNSINIKPTLFQYKQYLYSFNSFNNDNKIYFERTNLITGKPNWEKIVPKYDINKISFLNFKGKNFGVSQGKNDDIIFCGGEDADINIIIYEPNNNILSCKNNNNENIKVKLSDKVFYNINKEHNIILPATLSIRKEIIVLNKIKETMRLINFDKFSNSGKKVKLKEVLEKKEDNIGRLIVKAKIHERLRFEIQPQIVEAQKLSFDNKGNIVNEDEIINMEFNPRLNKDFESYLNKKQKKKNEFYLSNDVVYNNFVNLLVVKMKGKK